VYRAVVRIALLAVSLTVAAVVAGYAAAIDLQSSLGSGSASVERCTSAALGVHGDLTGNDVASVTVSSVPASCGNATIQVAVDNGTAHASGSSTVPAGGGSVTVSLGTPVTMGTNVEIDVLLLGP
jgi:hypothetical protein